MFAGFAIISRVPEMALGTGKKHLQATSKPRSPTIQASNGRNTTEPG